MRFLRNSNSNTSMTVTGFNQGRVWLGDDTSEEDGRSANWWNDSFSYAMRTGLARSVDQPNASCGS